jgi:hypothetical protein
MEHSGTTNVSYLDFTSKLHPCSFDVAAAAKALFRLAARNTSYFAATSCRGFQFHVGK